MSYNYFVVLEIKMQNKYSRHIFLEVEKNLLVTCRQEFFELYSLFSKKTDFSEACTLKNLSKDLDISNAAKQEFVKNCELLRNDILLQITARDQSISRLENVIARVRFIRLRYRIGIK